MKVIRSGALKILAMQRAIKCVRRYLFPSSSNRIKLSKRSSLSRLPVWKYWSSKSKVSVVASVTTTSAEASTFLPIPQGFLEVFEPRKHGEKAGAGCHTVIFIIPRKFESDHTLHRIRHETWSNPILGKWGAPTKELFLSTSGDSIFSYAKLYKRSLNLAKIGA